MSKAILWRKFRPIFLQILLPAVAKLAESLAAAEALHPLQDIID